jgi:hypothetical protein
MNSKNMLILLLLFSTQTDAQTTLDRQAFSKLKPEAQAIVQTWLNKNCGAAEQKKFEIQLSQLGNVLEPAFWEAFHKGPTEQDLKTIQNATVKRFQDRNKWLLEFGDVQMGKEETNRQLGVSQEQYVEREVSQYRQRYKTSALSGIGLIGTDQSELELKQIANDAENPAQTAAQETLKVINQQRKQ